MMHTQWPIMWLATNGLTALAYLLIAAILYRERQIRGGHWLLFAALIGTGALHHVVHAAPVLMGWGHPGDDFSPMSLDSAQLFADLAMSGIAVYTACVIGIDHTRSDRSVET